MTYYKEVGTYYDKDAQDFEKRYWKNPALQRIRQAFREEVKMHSFHNALEIGFGPGFDLVHFAKIFPDSQICGLDVSEEMVQLADQKIVEFSLANAEVGQGSVEALDKAFEGVDFEMIYVFFGALNTVEDLEEALRILNTRLHAEGRMVLTFVNKWFIAGMLIELLKLSPKRAFARLRKVWGGYSPTEFLASRCYSKRDIKRLAKNVGLEVVKREGFSITYPAWYYHRLHQKLPKRLLQMLWNFDRKITSGWLGGFGEYALYELRKEEAR